MEEGSDFGYWRCYECLEANHTNRHYSNQIRAT